jgi:hypothetical protein
VAARAGWSRGGSSLTAGRLVLQGAEAPLELHCGAGGRDRDIEPAGGGFDVRPLGDLGDDGCQHPCAVDDGLAKLDPWVEDNVVDR